MCRWAVITVGHLTHFPPFTVTFAPALLPGWTSRISPRPSMITGCLGSGGHHQAKWSPFSPFMLISSVINRNKRCRRISSSTLRHSCWDFKAKQVTNRKKITAKYFFCDSQTTLLIFGICDILLAHLKKTTKKQLKYFPLTQNFVETEQLLMWFYLKHWKVWLNVAQNFY